MNTIAPISRSITQTNRAFKPRTPRDILRLGKGAAVDVTKHPYNKGINLPTLQVPFPEADLPLATTTQQRILELGPSDDKDAQKLTQNLSALAARNALANTAMATSAK